MAEVPRLSDRIEQLAAIYERRFTRTTLARFLAVMEVTHMYSHNMDAAEEKAYLGTNLAQMANTDKAVRASGRIRALLKRVDARGSGKKPRRRRRRA